VGVVVSVVVGLTLSSSVAPQPAATGAVEPPEPAAKADTLTMHVLRAAVTARRPATVRLVVRVFQRDRVVRTVRHSVRVAGGGRTTRTRMAIRTTRRSPKMTVRLVTPRRLGDGFRLHRVRWYHRTARYRLSNGCRYGRRGLPACGAYLGQTYGSNTDPSPLENTYGRRLGIRRTYYGADQVSSALSTARGDLAHGRLPWVSFKLPTSWARVADGAADEWARALARRFGRLDGPVWLAFHHEPEGDGPIQDWRRMQEHLAPIVRRQDNLAFTVIVTGWHQFYGDDEYSLANIWPSGVVDVAGFDIYNQLGVVKDGETNTKGTDLALDYFAKIAPWARRQGVAWGLSETGFTHAAARVDPHWIRRTHRQLVNAGGVAFTYFNTTLNSIAPWDLSTPVKRAGWREAQSAAPLLPR
jgi:hypothetical protein